jgi:hypothetical protein
MDANNPTFTPSAVDIDKRNQAIAYTLQPLYTNNMVILYC